MYTESQNYISAFAPQMGKSASVSLLQESDSIHYTIVICSMDHVVKDFLLTENNKIKIIPMGEIYRYIFSAYSSLEKAYADLAWIQKLYPRAYIRTFEHGKLGQAINLKY